MRQKCFLSVTKNKISYKLEAVDFDSWNQRNPDNASETPIIIQKIRKRKEF
jgi:hypothetical protein